MGERLLNTNQSDSCTNQLLAITHEIFQALDYKPTLKVRLVFLDISKTFDKVWHEGLLCKLRSFRRNSSWKPVLAGVLQGSILVPLLFLVYINDLPNELKSNVKLYADDTSVFTIVREKNESANILSNDLLAIFKWVYIWKMLFNSDPSKPT